MNDTEKIKLFLSEQQFMVLAVTLDDGIPWATPVKIQYWEGNIFEWDSKLDTEHSKAIEQRPEIAITIFQKQEDSQIGFYAKGIGECVETKEHGVGRYRFTVKEAWLNDETFVKRAVTL
jgi:hypothetical protein